MVVNVAADPGPVAGLRWEWARGADPTLPAETDNEFVAAVRDWMSDPTRTVWAKVVLSPSLRSIPLYRRCGFTDDNDLMVWRPGHDDGSGRVR